MASAESASIDGSTGTGKYGRGPELAKDVLKSLLQSQLWLASDECDVCLFVVPSPMILKEAKRMLLQSLDR
jgi:GTPase Era involved in 16S rRNA processing